MDKFIYISDVHVPFEDYNQVVKALQAMKKEKGVDVVVLGGDIIDFFKVSSYSKNPMTQYSFQDEVERAKKFLKTIRSLFKKQKIYYLEGNHENRLKRYLCDKAPELIGFRPLDFEELMGLKELNIKYYTDTEVLHIDDWVFRHGHELGGGSMIPGNNARKGVAFYGANYVQGHVHRANVINVGTYTGDFMGVENPHLGESNPDYVKGYAQWQQGFTIGEKINDKWQIRQIIL